MYLYSKNMKEQYSRSVNSESVNIPIVMKSEQLTRAAIEEIKDLFEKDL